MGGFVNSAGGFLNWRQEGLTDFTKPPTWLCRRALLPSRYGHVCVAKSRAFQGLLHELKCHRPGSLSIGRAADTISPASTAVRISGSGIFCSMSLRLAHGTVFDGEAASRVADPSLSVLILSCAWGIIDLRSSGPASVRLLPS